MKKELLRSAWVEIDRKRLCENIRAVQRRVSPSRIIGVVKANAYGHGAVEVSRAYLENGVDILAVATLPEAKQLRDAGVDCRVLMMGLIPDELIPEALALHVVPLVSTLSHARALSRCAEAARQRAEVMIAVDTGMGRIGFAPDENAAGQAAQIADLPDVSILGLMTHFSSADMEDLTYTYGQKAAFDRFYEMLKSAGVRIPLRTAANSPAILRLPETFYDAVRPGTVVWGCYPRCVRDRETVRVRPVMSVKCRVIHLKTVPRGTAISYGGKFVTERESVIATLPLGYADGYTRTLLGKGRVLIRGQYAPVLGTICMDQIMVDVTCISGAEIGDEAVLLGRQGGREIPVEELEDASGLCSGELFYGFTCRLPIVTV